MEDGEGSVQVDGETFDDSEDDSQSDDNSSTENVNNQSEESSENADAEDTSDKKDDQEEESDKKDTTTDKGTKADPNPLSRANQERANAEAKVKQYDDFLNDPRRVKAYLAELEAERGEKSEPVKESEELAKLDPDKLETPEDVRNFAKALKEATLKEIADVKKQFSGFTESQQQDKTNSRISQEIDTVKSKYPELREFNGDGTKNPDFNKELENLIGETYESLDYDPKSKQFRGQISLMSIADKFMGAKRIGEGSGSRKAQTDVIDKRNGRVTTSQTNSGASTTDDAKLSPSATIADRMRRAAAKR